MNATVIAAVVSVMGMPLGPQWLNHPTPGIPRTAGARAYLNEVHVSGSYRYEREK